MKPFSLFLLLAMSSPLFAQAPVILVLGDSLSAAYGMETRQGWVSLLQERLHERGYPHQVINASISGDTTASALTRLPALLEPQRADILIVELGGNDGLRGLPFDHTRENLRRIVRLGRENGSRVLLLGMRLPPNYGSYFTRRFQQIYADLARVEGAGLVPFFLRNVAEDLDLMQDDGIHPRAAAQGRLLDNVWVELEPLLDE